MAMPKEPALTVDALCRLLSYDADTGMFSRRLNNPGSARTRSMGGKLSNSGYIILRLEGRYYQAHRVAWAVFYGVWPTAFIDHINRCRSDNRIANLREASGTQNQANRIYAPPSGLPRGVRELASGRFQANIQVAGLKRNLGTYASIQEASDAYRRVADEEFGDFANYGG